MTLDYREKCKRIKGEDCHVCGSGDNVVIHHINGDDDDCRITNLIPLCRSCHGKVHSTKPTNPHINALSDQLPAWSNTDRSVSVNELGDYTGQTVDSISDSDYGKVTRVNEHGSVYVPDYFRGETVKVALKVISNEQR